MIVFAITICENLWDFSANFRSTMHTHILKGFSVIFTGIAPHKALADTTAQSSAFPHLVFSDVALPDSTIQ